MPGEGRYARTNFKYCDFEAI